MKKIKLNYYLLFSLLVTGVVLTSCNTDDATGDSTLVVADNVSGIVVTDFDSSATINVNESDEEEFTYTVTLDQAQPVDIHVHVVQTAGDATADEDFEFESDLLIPAYTTSVTGSITILNDDTVEGMESFTLEIGDRTSNASVAVRSVSFTINNFESSDLDLYLTFGKEFLFGGENLEMCDIGYDMDYLVLDDTFSDIGNYTGATGACPTEHVVLSVDPSSDNYVADGTYYIIYSIYDDGGLDGLYHEVFDIPTSVEYLRSGLITEGSFDQEAAFVPTSISGNGDENLVCVVEVLNGVFTIKYSDETTVIASGRMAAPRISPSYLAHKQLTRN